MGVERGREGGGRQGEDKEADEEEEEEEEEQKEGRWRGSTQHGSHIPFSKIISALKSFYFYPILIRSEGISPVHLNRM